MAALEPANYKLKHGGANPSSGSSKRFIFVKLTDSALKAIEDYQQRKDTGQASIQLGEKEGCIRLPAGNAFNFAVAEMKADGPNGSFECVRKSKKGELDYLGDINQRVTIHAKEDSFNTALERITTQDEKSKKQCAKEIETSRTGPNISSRVKVKRPGDPLSGSSSKKQKPDPVSAKPFAFTASKKPTTSQPVIKPATSYPTRPSLPSSQAVSRTSFSNNLAAPENVSVTLSPSSGPKNLKSLRERVIHALALRPMLKADLIGKLQKFGYKEENERLALEQLLPEVSSYKDGKYDLLPEFSSQIDPKWSSYSTSDSTALQKRLSMLENRPEASKGISKSSSVGTVFRTANNPLSVTSVTKGKGRAEVDYAEQDLSRALLAHPNPGADLSPPPSGSSTCSTPSPPDHTHMKSVVVRGGLKITGISGLTNNVLGSPGGINNLLNLDKDEYRNSIEAQYPQIHAVEERRRYKKDFYADYRAYQDLHEHMARISAKFLELEGKLRKTKQGSSEYRSVARCIKDEYLRLKNDEDYKTKRKHWENLTTKLSLIKLQIKSYDALAIKA